jgi:hypothetical protein
MIDESMTFVSQNVIIRGDQSARTIEKGSLTIHANDNNLSDAVPPLWKQDDKAIEKVTFKDVDNITDRSFNSLILGSDELNPDRQNIDITFSDAINMFKEKGKKTYILIHEVGFVDKDGKRSKLAQPSQQKALQF